MIMTKPIIQPEPFPKDSSMFDITEVQTDLSTPSVSLSLIVISAFEFE